MPLSSLVVVVLRLFAVYWLIQSVTQSIMIGLTTSIVGFGKGPGMISYTIPIILILVGLPIFAFSVPLSRRITPDGDPMINFGALTLHDLYCFAFVLLGGYFFLSSISSTFTTLHAYVTMTRSMTAGNPMQKTLFYQMAVPLTSLILGGLTMLYAPRLARKLALAQPEAHS